MPNLINDLSTLTGIGQYNLEELVAKSIAVISHDVAESIRDKEAVTSINIGIGELLITNVENVVKYKFIPAARLERAIVATFEAGESSLALSVDEALGKRIQNTYKDLF